jgi:tetratricopeptide (TPR) repeat protein
VLVVNNARRWIDAGWPAALLLLFVGTFRTAGSDPARDIEASICEAAALDVAALERCLALDPGNAELMTDLGDEYLHTGNSAGAETMYRRALAVDARDGDTHLRLGELLLARGDAAAARAEGKAALEVQPGSLAAERLIERATLKKERK